VQTERVFREEAGRAAIIGLNLLAHHGPVLPAPVASLNEADRLRHNAARMSAVANGPKRHIASPHDVSRPVTKAAMEGFHDNVVDWTCAAWSEEPDTRLLSRKRGASRQQGYKDHPNSPSTHRPGP
jgi:hypothetical protein